MSNIIDSIKLSGVTYTIQGSGGGGNPTVELTEAQYDALVTAGTVQADTYYIITDAQGGDLSNYMSSAQTMSAITEATSGKVDSNVYTAYTASTDTAIQGKQDTLVSGTNIKTINNESLLGSGNITIQGGGGGGKAIEAGKNISITTGETADTINCTLPCYRDSGNIWTMFGYSSSTYSNNSSNATDSVYIGYRNEIKNTNISYKTYSNIIIGWNNKLDSYYNAYGVGYNVVVGEFNTLSGSNNIRESYVIGRYNKGYASDEFICGWSNEARNYYETSFGHYNNSVSGSPIFGNSGNTLFSVGNGTANNARHNAFEIRQNGDIYYFDGTNDVKLQDKFSSLDSTIGDINTILESI